MISGESAGGWWQPIICIINRGTLAGRVRRFNETIFENENTLSRSMFRTCIDRTKRSATVIFGQLKIDATTFTDLTAERGVRINSNIAGRKRATP